MERLEDIKKRREKINKVAVTYLDNKGQVVTKEKASQVIITEYDKEGNVINEVRGSVNNEKEVEEER